MDYSDTLLLYGLERMDGERTVSGLYHLLTGKKSSQTVQDGKLFGLSHLFGTFHGYTYARFEEKMQDFIQSGWINLTDASNARLTERGQSVLDENLKRSPIPTSLDGWRYGDIGTVFWRRFTLYVQTLSHLLENERHFYPIQNDPQVLQWVKRHFPRDPRSRHMSAEGIYSELKILLSTVEGNDADNFVLRLSRKDRIGKTTRQIGEIIGLDPFESHIRFLGTLHKMIQTVMADRRSFPHIHIFIADCSQPYTLTESTRKTFELLKDGYTFDDIVRIRKLKESTIEDHIVEIAIHVPEFEISPFISIEDQKRIFAVSKRLRSKRLKWIKQELQEEFSYFQIRLTLAKGIENVLKEEKGVRSRVD
ncbi:helix-turn-helix domain-containing protein [Pseudalkalibacillus sp. SCS-8]|uniref:helix-turn-helix domain-containing protein n=1 Tax=Pseudalkalibacillus nanhaiensis TaxID=3115291 RepID=UPI0032DAC356